MEKKRKPPKTEEGTRGPKRPHGLPPNLTEDEVAIMPDFKKWQKVFLNLYLGIVAVAIVIKVSVFAYLNFYVKSSDTGMSYFISSVLFPLVIDIVIYIVGSGMMRHMKELDMRKNFIPIFMLELLNYSMCIIPRHIFFVMMIGFAVPICMTTVFSSKKMCSLVTRISQIGIIIASVKQIVLAIKSGSTGLLPVEQSDALWYIPQALIIFAIVTIVGIVAQSTLSMTAGQRQKLLDYTQSIREAQRRAEAANIAKSTFLANMSHEIRTPINAILGMNEMILRENTNEQIEGYALNIQTAGTSLLYQVNDVLDISKIESGRLEIVETNYDTSSFVHDCCNMIAERAKQKNLQVIVECNENLPAQLHGDEIRLRQIVTNLLSNACKYTEKGSITLTVTGEREGNKFTLDVSVKDTGIGIKEENLQKLFDQFTRFDLEKNRNIEGTGLGLAIAKRLVDLMDGEIKVQSIYGMGSLFRVVVPQEIVDATPIGDYSKRYEANKEKGAKYKQSLRAPSAKILVVDDVEMNLKVITNLLKKTEMQVDTALSGRLCLEKAAQTEYDVIFMDHMMPEMDGVETFLRLKNSEDSLNKNTPVIMLTANAVTGVREKFLQEGFADYLSKPVLAPKLEAMLVKYLPREKVIAENQDSSAQNAASTSPQPVEQPKPQEAPKPIGEVLPNDESQNARNAIILKKFKQAYPAVDLEMGLSYCGEDSEIYLAALKSFGDTAKIEEIEKLYAENNASNYQILVHGVKSSSLGIGLTELSEKAKALEAAARDGDRGFIETNHAVFIEEYKHAVEIARSIFSD